MRGDRRIGVGVAQFERGAVPIRCAWPRVRLSVGERNQGAALGVSDLDALAPLAAQHGPTVDEVATPLERIPEKATSPAFFKA